jgi:hypothetical protein
MFGEVCGKLRDYRKAGERHKATARKKLPL